jgi:hypothetical protein
MIYKVIRACFSMLLVCCVWFDSSLGCELAVPMSSYVGRSHKNNIFVRKNTHFTPLADLLVDSMRIAQRRQSGSGAVNIDFTQFVRVLYLNYR